MVLTSTAAASAHREPPFFTKATNLEGVHSKRGSASYIVREVHSVREREIQREREREREKDGSDVTIVALKLAMSFTLFLAKNVHLILSKSFALFLAKKFAPQFLPS